MQRLQYILKQAHALARDKLMSYQLREQKDYGLKLKVNTYDVGDLVYVLDTAKKVGFSPKQYWKGPTLVVKVISCSKWPTERRLLFSTMR